MYLFGKKIKYDSTIGVKNLTMKIVWSSIILPVLKLQPKSSWRS